MAFTPINKSTDYFNTKLYTGTSSGNQAVTGVGFQPDWIWTKNRVDAFGSNLYDVLRGTGYYLQSNNTSASQSAVASLISFDSDGFTVGTGDNVQYTSNNGVAWNWKANGQGSSNTDGSINTTYTSANTTSGFSIIQYTGNATAGATIGHGLGKVPEFIIFRRYAQAENWGVYIKAAEGATDFKRIFFLNETNGASIDTTVLNNTEPSSSLITLGTSALSNVNNNPYIAYAFTPIQGFSKFEMYSGNGSTDGPFAYTGFKPSFIMIKANANDSWRIYDSKRVGYNVDNKYLNANTTAGETIGSTLYIDILSNGFKIRGTDTSINGAGTDYYYMAFAEAPLVGSNNVPANAR